MGTLLEYIAGLVISVIDATGYWGIGFLMAVESANIPVPSEIIMPFSGFLASRNELSLFWVVLVGGVGNLAGSLLSYYVAAKGGRPFLRKYGKYFFVSEKDIASSERLFAKYGSWAAFFSRLLPIVRTFISFPAGLAGMNIWKFSSYTLAGSLLWSWFLAYLGFQAGENWDTLEVYFKRFDWAIALLLFLGLVWWIVRHLRNNSHA